MFTIKEVQKSNIEPYIRQAYTSYTSVEKWHEVGELGVEACIKDTANGLKTGTLNDFQFFLVQDGDTFVGYFGTECNHSYLTTFFIHPNYRSKKEEFWNTLLPFLNSSFTAAIHSKNLPCIKFYEKMGKVLHRDQSVTVFQFSGV